MSVTLELRYPWGRIHATPWGAHTNEAVADWPPAPRRILRTLYAVWKTRCPDLPEGVVHGLLEQLTALPVYGTDPVRPGLTRHFLPADKHTAGDYQRDLALDTFLACRSDRGAIVRWEVDLTPEQHEALARLVEQIPFLGRGESLCEITLTDAVPEDRPIRWHPLDPTHPAEGEVVDLLVAEAPLDREALTETPAQIRSSKRLWPSGARLVPYVSTGSSPAEQTRGRFVVRRRPSAIRFRLDGRAPVHVRQSLAVADLLRQAALSKGPDGSHTLSGRAEAGRRTDQHQHAHYLVFATAGDYLDSAVIWAPEGFDDEHVRALTNLRWLRSGYLKEVPPLRMVLEGLGPIDRVAPEITTASHRWRTVTPFVITRYPKDRRPLDEHVVEQVRDELGHRGLPEGRITVDADPSAMYFRRHRPGRSLRLARPARHVELEFDVPVSGPMCLGALAHFSLGLFLPVP
ncbi:type I-G CRISPR-associated protein Csb2 [Rhabdothermincola sediminis]|uniref:type I-G CRISPR-associated protein Csb2 n=1 Tax=Rhabdothermincola sediminis TaxID=2751370 RepID=UPI001AA05DA5|nr:type I-U CRISPR-associated protein Csb2 [Rhabdothermincola sediminis]